MREIEVKPAERLLAWYDKNARVLPWRVGPRDRAHGVVPDPYHVWLSEIMLQQTTVVTVIPYFQKFLANWPRITDLAGARDEDVLAQWAGLGYYARARNLLKCARVIVAEHDGVFPADYTSLLRLPGIGPYTAAAIAAIAFDHPATVLDGNVERVMSRLYAVKDPLPDAKEVLRARAAKLTPKQRAGDYAQAVMDLGATICRPKSPQCGQCPWEMLCQARAENRAEDFPKKKKKAPKPTRFGHAFVLCGPQGAVWLVKRPETGLLGGMLGFPGSDWGPDELPAVPPLKADWHAIEPVVTHVFTHFRLELRVWVTKEDHLVNLPLGHFVPQEAFDPNHLPTVMKKVWQASRTLVL